MNWIEKLDGAVIVSDADDRIIYLNELAIKNYEKEGGAAIIGRNLMDCHSEPSREKIREIKRTLQKNVYTIEKKGKKKLIYQTPWVEEGVLKGVVELSLEIPFDMPHFIRDLK